MRKMKDSGIEWIGKIPEDWNIVRIKFTLEGHYAGEWGSNKEDNEADCICVRVADFDYPRLEVKFHDDMTIRSYTQKTIDKSSLKRGDILLEKSGGGEVTPVGRSVIFDSDNTMMFANFIECLRPLETYDSHFLNYWLSSSYVNGFSKRNIKQTTGIQNLDITAFLSEKIALPNKEKQSLIANYLDKKCAEIDALIEAKEKANALLKEQRQSIIYEAVTKGLNPNVPMKDSGIEWIGKIPKNWNITRIKYTSILKGRIGWQGLKSDEYINEGPYLITGVDFVDGRIDWNNCFHISKQRYDEAPEIHIFEGDLLITKDGTIGKLAIAENCPKNVSLNSGVLLIRNKKNGDYLNRYLYYVLQSDVFWKWFRLSQNGNSTIIHLYQEQFSNFRYSLPSIEEQKNIISHLDNSCDKLDKLISTHNITIEKLKEYRKSIIFEAVTGKVEI